MTDDQPQLLFPSCVPSTKPARGLLSEPGQKGTSWCTESTGWFGSHSNTKLNEIRLYLAYQHLVLQLGSGKHSKNHQWSGFMHLPTCRSSSAVIKWEEEPADVLSKREGDGKRQGRSKRVQKSQGREKNVSRNSTVKGVLWKVNSQKHWEQQIVRDLKEQNQRGWEDSM